MNKRLLEIRARKMEIRKALEGEGKVNLNALQEELKNWMQNRRKSKSVKRLPRAFSSARNRKACRKEASPRPP